MKKITVTSFLLLISFLGFTQIRFETGYYVTKYGKRINCLIKDTDWKNNPIKFDYKLNEAGQIESKSVEEVSEFGIITGEKKVKYVSTEVNIDRSSNIDSKLSTNRLPEWNQEKLFLKVLIEGETSLYFYEDKNLRRFFFSTVRNDSIQQLVYKRYRPEVTVAKTNNTFRQQLLSFVKCEDVPLTDIENINYNLKNLLQFFSTFNKTCSDREFEVYVDRSKANDKVKVALKVIGSFNNSQFQITNRLSFDRPALDFKRATNIGGGFEFEVFLPFNRNKWRLVAGSNYQYYNSINEYVLEFPTRAVSREASIEYSSIDIIVGLRHYFYLNDNWKVFANGGYAYDVTAFDSYARRAVNSLKHEIIGNGTYFIGLGSEFKAMSLELRYYGNKNIINAIQDIANPDIISSYNRLSINLGVRVF